MIAVVGLSHRTAPIEVREKLALNRDSIISLLRELVLQEGVGEALLISTCNRVELVAASAGGPLGPLAPAAQAGFEALAGRAPLARPYLYRKEATDAVRHLLRVASSLDSLVLGEPQILGQVKNAFELARSAGTVGTTLYRVITRALKTAKRVRHETAIGSGQVSVPTVALDLAEQIFGDLRGRCVVLVGTGEMGETVARLLRQEGAEIVVVGRNAHRCAELAARFHGQSLPWEQLEPALVRADVVITSTSAPHAIVGHAMLMNVRRARRGRSLFLIDVAVPRDIDPSVDNLDGVYLYNIDDLSRVVATTMSHRQLEADRAEQIVEREVAGYERWVDARQVTPTIIALRERLSAILESELDRSLRGRLKHLGSDERSALDAMLGAALNKMLHEPSVRLKEAAATQADEAEQLAAAISDLFALEPTSEGQRTPRDCSLAPPASSEEVAPSEGQASPCAELAKPNSEGLDSGTG